MQLQTAWFILLSCYTKKRQIYYLIIQEKFQQLIQKETSEKLEIQDRLETAKLLKRQLKKHHEYG
jgi:hypothetical protein